MPKSSSETFSETAKLFSKGGFKSPSDQLTLPEKELAAGLLREKVKVPAAEVKISLEPSRSKELERAALKEAGHGFKILIFAPGDQPASTSAAKVSVAVALAAVKLKEPAKPCRPKRKVTSPEASAAAEVGRVT
jgi:hypothetical protein